MCFSFLQMVTELYNNHDLKKASLPLHCLVSVASKTFRRAYTERNTRQMCEHFTITYYCRDDDDDEDDYCKQMDELSVNSK